MVVFPLKVRFANALVSYVKYMGKMIWPQGLAVFYPHPGNSLPEWQVVGAFLLLTLLSLLAVRTAWRYPYVLVGWLWYLGTLVPVIGLVQVGEQALADRYTYVPLIGLFIITAWGVSDLVKRWRYGLIVLATATGIVLSVMFACTLLQVGHWKNSIDLFEHTLRVTANNYPAHNNLGVALERKGRLKEAVAYYEQALRIKPDFVEVHNNLGNVLGQQGKFEGAISHFSRALELKPNSAETHYNMGNVLARQGKLEKATSLFSKALELEPDFAQAYNNMGAVLSFQGKYREAIACFSLALRLKPHYAEAGKNLEFVQREASRLAK